MPPTSPQRAREQPRPVWLGALWVVRGQLRLRLLLWLGGGTPVAQVGFLAGLAEERVRVPLPPQHCQRRHQLWVP